MSFQDTLEQLLDPALQLRSSALVELSDLAGDDQETLVQRWPDIDPVRRLKVVQTLSEILEDNIDLNFDAVFKNALEDPDAEVRAAAIRGLFEYEAEDMIPVLAGLMRDDPDEEVRAVAAEGLGRYALAAEHDKLSEAAVVRVRQTLTDSAIDMSEEETVRAKAIEALGALSGEETSELIESVYDEGTLRLRIGAVDAMGRSCDEAWLPHILQELNDDDAEMRHAAAFAAGCIGDEGAIPSLAELAMGDEDFEVRVAAVRALGEIGGRLARVALNNLIYEGDHALRDAISEAMAELSFAEDPLRPS